MPEDATTPAASPAAELLGRPLPRRRLLAGVGAAGLTGLLAGCGSGGAAETPPTATPPPAPTANAGQPTPAAAAKLAASAGQQVANLPAGMALVTSPRLPLFGIGANEVPKLLAGGLNWEDVGCPIRLGVEVLALAGQVPAGAQPVATFPDYAALIAGLDQHRGGVAMIPVDQVDFRVNVLSVSGHDPLRDRTDDSLLRLAVVGDIVPGRNVHFKMVAYHDFTHPFLKVANQLKSYDLTIANLEGDLSRNLGQPAEKDPHTFSFVSDPAMIDGLKLAGIDAVSLANNHTTWNDAGWGAQGLLDTMANLDAAGLPRFGGGATLAEARKPWVTQARGRSVALLGFDGVTGNLAYPQDDPKLGTVGSAWAATDAAPGTNPFDFDHLASDVAAAVKQYQVVIPYLHMGAEYKIVVPDWVVKAAHAAIDAGATMVVTNHPHIIQGMEVYAGKPIIYSVGNFIFDQMFSVEVREGLILEAAIDARKNNQVVGIRLTGVEIADFNQPRLMSQPEHASIMDRFWRSTDRLAGV